MSTAVLISGQARTFAQCFPTQHWQVFRKLSDPWFFVSVSDDAQAQDMEILRTRYKNVFIERVVQPVLPEPENAKELIARAPFVITASVQAILRQFWHLQRVWEWMRSCQAPEFDTFVRIRPDLFFHRCKIPDPILCYDCYSPWWSRWGGINDRFAVMGKEAAKHYFGTYSIRQNLWDSGCPLHPESMLAEALEVGGVRSIDTLDALFSTLRMDGRRIAPDPMTWDRPPS